jgi:hypothetical protein
MSRRVGMLRLIATVCTTAVSAPQRGRTEGGENHNPCGAPHVSRLVSPADHLDLNASCSDRADAARVANQSPDCFAWRRQVCVNRD